MTVCTETLKSIVSNLLPNVTSEDFCITPVLGGRNNRTYHIKLDHSEYFLKQYNKNSGKNRLKAEYAFLSYAKNLHCPYTVKPISLDVDTLFALYEYKQGQRYQVDKVSQSEISHALKFIHSINQSRFLSHTELPVAREACFTIKDHIDCVDKRIQRLNNMVVFNDIDQQAFLFIQNKLTPVWSAIKSTALQKSERYLHAVLPIEDRIISPSDFGFHNALKLSDGKIVFVDFEYAGWDDPAKLIGDFFNQVEVPISISYFSECAESISTLLIDRHAFLERSKLLFPVYNIKWCCIILNYFLPGSRIAKEFSETVTQSLCEEQLEKAKLRLEKIDRIIS